jgi:hypothetical protein
MTEKILEGQLLLYSETGMEGGYLSIQDNRFVSLQPPMYGVSNNCKVWDKDDTSRHGLTSDAEVLIDNKWLEFPDPIWKDEDFKLSTLYNGELNGDLAADKRLSERYEFRIKYAIERLNETYGEGKWQINRKLPYVTLKDGTQLHFSDVPTAVPSRPYGIPQGGKTRVTVTWNDGKVEHKKLSDELLIKQADMQGLHILKPNDVLKVADPILKNIICEGQVDEIPLKVFSQTIDGHFDLINQTESHDWETYFIKNYNAELYRNK